MIWPFSLLQRRYGKRLEQRLDSLNEQSTRRHDLLNDINQERLELQYLRNRANSIARTLGIEPVASHHSDADRHRSGLHGADA